MISGAWKIILLCSGLGVLAWLRLFPSLASPPCSSPSSSSSSFSSSSFRSLLPSAKQAETSKQRQANRTSDVVETDDVQTELRFPNLTIYWIIPPDCSGLQVASVTPIYAFYLLGARIVWPPGIKFCLYPLPVAQMIQEMEELRLTHNQTTMVYDVFVCGSCLLAHLGTTHPLPKFKYFVLKSMWETTDYPRHIQMLLHRADEVWVPTHFNLETYSQAVPREKIFLLPESIDMDLFSRKSVARILSDPLDESMIGTTPRSESVISLLESVEQNRSKYNFFFNGFIDYRKNWDGLIRAYVRTFTPQDDVTLWIFEGAGRAETAPELRSFLANITDIQGGPAYMPRIEVITSGSHWYSIDLAQLYYLMDCYVFPSHGEGWALPLMESMSMELPVIVTAWGGSTEFAAPLSSNQENSTFFGGWGVKYGKEMEKAYQFRIFKEDGYWVIPDEGHLGRIMRYAYEHPEEGKARGRAGRQSILKKFSLAKIGQIGARRMHEIAKKIAREEYSKAPLVSTTGRYWIADRWPP